MQVIYDKTEAILESLGYTFVRLVGDELEEKDKVATGKTKNSLRLDIVNIGTIVEFNIYGSIVIDDIERGREAFEIDLSPNDEGILQWMAAVDIPEEASYLIVRSIYENPLQGVDLLTDAIKEIRKAIQTEVINGVLKDWTKAIQQIEIIKDVEI